MGKDLKHLHRSHLSGWNSVEKWQKSSSPLVSGPYLINCAMSEKGKKKTPKNMTTPCWKQSARSCFFIKLHKSGTLYLFFFCLDWTHAFTSHRITLKPQSCHETVTKGIEPTWSSPSRSVIVRKCCVCTPSMAFIVKKGRGLVLSYRCLTFLSHPW